MVLAGDGDRERATASLREHFLSGRLTLDELSARTELVLRARSVEELRRALVGLPQFNLRAAAHSAIRGECSCCSRASGCCSASLSSSSWD